MIANISFHTDAELSFKLMSLLMKMLIVMLMLAVTAKTLKTLAPPSFFTTNG